MELDIIAIDADELAIIEVKARKKNSLVSPNQAVDKKKQQHIITAAQAFIEQNNINLECRFDIIEVEIDNSEKKINHIKSAFYTTLK